jgi:hypothetical protein
MTISGNINQPNIKLTNHQKLMKQLLPRAVEHLHQNINNQIQKGIDKLNF